MTTRVAAVGPCLAIAHGGVTQPQMEAVTTSLCWAEAVARTTTSDVSDPRFYDAMTSELARIEWNVDDASSTAYHQSGSNVTPASIIPAVLKPSLDAASFGAVDRVFDSVGQPSVPPALGSLLTTWWSSQSRTGSSQAFSVCPATVDTRMNAVSSTIVFYDFGFRASQWQSFFVTAIGAHVDVQIRTVHLALNLASWDDIRDDILSRLGSAAVDNVVNLVL